MPTQKKKELSLKGSYLRVWTDNNGKPHSKAKGSIEQIQAHFDTMITYLHEQAKTMNVSSVRMLGNNAPDAIIGMISREQPRMTNDPRYFQQTLREPTPQVGGQGGSRNDSINDNKK